MVGDYAQLRERMVQEQLVLRGINDPRVLWAMAKVPRHLFVEREFWDRAYDDCPLPIGENQTISQPYIVALTVEALRLEGTEKVLEVGTGSGYAAAVLAELCAEVFSVEAVETLASKARTILASLGYRKVSALVGDGTLGWEEHAPYDAIVISAAAPCIPRPLVGQLRSPGYLVLPMGEKELQSLVRIRKDAEGIELPELHSRCRRQQLFKHVTSVERRNGNQIEAGECQIEIHAPKHHALQQRQCRGETGNRLPKLPHQHEYNRANDEQRQVSGDPGERDDDVAADVAAVVPWIDRNGFRGAEYERRVRSDEDGRQEDRHHRVYVLERIQGHPPQHVGSRVTLSVGSFSVRIFMRHNGKQQDGDL